MPQENISLPTAIEMEKKGPHQSLFVIEPLWPGYGMTIGNALRRVLLSSLRGAAITAVRVDNVDHEFSAIPNVKEDVVDIILNLKRVRLRLHGDEAVTVILHARGAKAVTAGDIEPIAQVEVVNPDQPIATLTDKAADLRMELTVAPGRGYVPVENREKEKLPIGTIAIDAVYTPVRNVNFNTEHVRVEQMTNFDKLMLDITTDGSITPSEALYQSTNIMVEHFQFVLQGASKFRDQQSSDEAEKIGETEAKTKKKAGRKKKTDEPSPEGDK